MKFEEAVKEHEKKMQELKEHWETCRKQKKYDDSPYGYHIARESLPFRWFHLEGDGTWTLSKCYPGVFSVPHEVAVQLEAERIIRPLNEEDLNADDFILIPLYD